MHEAREIRNPYSLLLLRELDRHVVLLLFAKYMWTGRKDHPCHSVIVIEIVIFYESSNTWWTELIKYANANLCLPRLLRIVSQWVVSGWLGGFEGWLSKDERRCCNLDCWLALWLLLSHFTTLLDYILMLFFFFFSSPKALLRLNATIS